MVKVELASSVEEEASSLIPFLSWLDICCLPPRYPYSPFSAVRPLGFHQQAWFSTWGQFRVGKWPKPADQNLNTFLILLGQWCLLFLTIWLFQLFEQLQRRTLLPYGLRFSSRVILDKTATSDIFGVPLYHLVRAFCHSGGPVSTDLQLCTQHGQICKPVNQS